MSAQRLYPSVFLGYPPKFLSEIFFLSQKFSYYLFLKSFVVLLSALVTFFLCGRLTSPPFVVVNSLGYREKSVDSVESTVFWLQHKRKRCSGADRKQHLPPTVGNRDDNALGFFLNQAYFRIWYEWRYSQLFSFPNPQFMKEVSPRLLVHFDFFFLYMSFYHQLDYFHAFQRKDTF